MCITLRYEIIGGSLPALLCQLQKGEQIICENGSMTWMDDVFKMETSGGGIGKMFGRAFTGEGLFRNIYTAQQNGEIVFASKFPGNICAIELNGNSIISQKSAFLACTANIQTSLYFQQKMTTAAYSGEGLIMQKHTGYGIVFFEIDGSTREYTLAPGQRKIIDTGHLALMDETCSIDIVRIKGVKNAMLGGEGYFNTVITGPGKIILQTLAL